MSTIWTDLMGAQVHHLGNRYRTRVIEAGSGPGRPLLLLHGIGGHAEAYSRNVLRLAAGGRRVLAIDMLWHGFSSTPEYVDGEDIPAYADQIIDLMEAEGIDQVDIEGESLGGWVGLYMAIHMPECVGKLVLNTTAGVRWPTTEHGNHGHNDADRGGGRKALAERSIAAIEDPQAETIRKRLEWLMSDPARVTDELVAVRQRIYQQPDVKVALKAVFLNAFGGVGAPRREIPGEDLPKVQAPTLVLWTEHNPGTGPEVGQRIADAIPSARFVCMDDCGHWPQWEHPEEHDRIVLDFLDA